jgi:hypothetical protein
MNYTDGRPKGGYDYNDLTRERVLNSPLLRKSHVHLPKKKRSREIEDGIKAYLRGDYE